MTLRVLLVEDDAVLRRTLADALAVEGWTVLTAASLAEGLAVAAHGRPDLVLLDLGLPDGDGAALLDEWRRRQSAPLLVISARDDPSVRIALLDAGADDFLVKPFAIGELLARVRVALRHRGTALSPAVSRYEADGLAVDLERRSVVLHGAPVHLTPTEYALLARLLRSAGRVVTHRQLLADVWGAEHVHDTQYLRLYMGQLRAKLEARPSEPRWLITEPGVGYRFAE
jgi:two-component system KDP operon response regulator KdpE